ncbi:MAG: AMP-binding protein, partial [Magnetococcales bacterium]|nr:AMP-binding protein [Magnetococcales bacterium]
MKPPTFDPITPAEASTLHGLFRARVERTPHAPAYRGFDREAGRWRTFSWDETASLTLLWRKGMEAENLPPGERVALLLPNRLEWVLAEQAALGQGLITVPL